MNKESKIYVTLVTLTISTICAVLVSSVYVWMKPKYAQNKAIDVKKNILLAAGHDLRRFSNSDEIIAAYEDSIVRKEVYIGGIEHFVYYIRANDGDKTFEGIILPISGKGLFSTMYGFIALEMDFNTVRYITFYDHGETPGMGAQITSPAWQRQWIGKQIFDEQWNPRIRVVSRSLDEAVVPRHHQVDGITGATLTANGVERMVWHWLGEEGFLNYLRENVGRYD